MKKISLLLLFVLFAACSEERQSQGPYGTDSNSDTALSKEAEFQKIQDSILKNYSNAVKLINQIDTELSKLSDVPETSESYNLEAEILQKIDYLSFQLKARNEDINKLEIKLKSLGQDNKELQERIQTLESIIAEKDIIIATQNERITSLEGELSVTRSQLDVAMTDKQTIEKFALETEKEKNTAFYVIGYEKDLLKNNIIKMEGEGFLGIGGKYITSSDAEARFFTRIDITKDTLLPFPQNAVIEEIVSTHSRKLIDVQSSSSGSNLLRIRTPFTFWRSDKMLVIIIEEK